MKHALLLWILLLPLWLTAQPDTLHRQEEILFSDPEAPAQFPGGHPAMKKFIAENLQLPVELQDPHALTVKVWLQFRVSETGKISDIAVQRTTPECAACEAEAIRIVKLMPDWIPGSVNGKPVKSRFSLPVKFDPLAY